MTNGEMWNAVSTHDESYDGIFFYGVKTTGIFCRPSCKSKLPNKENIRYFPSALEAREAGFRPCKRCRSDLLEYQPMQEIAHDIKKKIDEIYKQQETVYEQLQDVGLSTRRLTDVFKAEYGFTPKEYADSLRLKEAKRLLSNGDDKIIDIAYATGFSSISAFNRFFKVQTSKTPTQYRRDTRCLEKRK